MTWMGQRGAPHRLRAVAGALSLAESCVSPCWWLIRVGVWAASRNGHQPSTQVAPTVSASFALGSQSNAAAPVGPPRLILPLVERLGPAPGQSANGSADQPDARRGDSFVSGVIV